MLREPALPAVATPDPIEIDPVVPELDVPELKDNIPLTPFVPASAEDIVMAPLDVAFPSPLEMLTEPAVMRVLSPAVTVTPPPAPLSALPTLRRTSPPLPPSTCEVPIDIAPVVPEDDVPELKASIPLTPPVPAFEVPTVIAPLVVEIP
jgi:hypothetical protein